MMARVTRACLALGSLLLIGSRLAAQTPPAEFEVVSIDDRDESGFPIYRNLTARNIASLEEGERGFAFASGLAAEDTVVRGLLNPGDHVVLPNDAYGGTHRLFDKVEQRWGLANTPAALSDLDAHGIGWDVAKRLAARNAPTT